MNLIELVSEYRTLRPLCPQAGYLMSRTVAIFDGWPGRTCEYWFRLRQMAGLASGGFHQLRRTWATLIAAASGIDEARRWLGHRSGDMWRHYVDERAIARRAMLPPGVLFR